MGKQLEAIELYKRGVRVAHIAVIVNVTKGTVYAWLKKAGLSPRRKK